MPTLQMLRQDVSEELPLFAAFPRLAEAVPWLSLGDWPTPVTEARHFAKACGLRALHLKREDLSHPTAGGNKVRGLEFLLGDARSRGARTLVTLGSVGGYHICRTAWHARGLGISTVALAVGQPVHDYVRRNVRAGLSVGTRFVVTSRVTLLPALAWPLLRVRWARDAGPVAYVPAGGTSPLACLGHVNAAFELKRQIEAEELPEPDYLYAAMGSLGTVAGLTVGCKLAGLNTRIVGVVASYRWYCTPGRWARLARRTLRLMQRHDPSVPEVRIAPSELTVVSTALGGGYARFTETGLAVARRFEDCERIELDGTYTAKALDGAISFIRERRVRDAVHLFWQSYQRTPEVGGVAFDSIPRGLRRYLRGAAIADNMIVS